MIQFALKNKEKNRIIVGNGEILIGDSMNLLMAIPDESFKSCITSPPYWGLRDYGIDGQIGAEFDLQDYIDSLRKIFSEVKRTLKKDGTLWLNIGDSYTSGNRKWRDSDAKNKGRAMSYRPPTPPDLKPKDLIGVPWKIAFALQMDGWYLRSDIIWNKPNCQPESVKDRPTRSHEYIFLFSKSKDYYYDQKSIMEPVKDGGKMKNRRSVWNINTNGFKDAHFAVFPSELVKVCLKAGSKEGDTILDPFFGSGTVGEIATIYNRRFVGLELNKEYAEMAKYRIDNLTIQPQSKKMPK